MAYGIMRIKVHSYGKGQIELQDTGERSDQALDHQMMEIARLIQDGA